MHFKKYEMSSSYQLCSPDDYLEQRRMFGSNFRKNISGSDEIHHSSSSSESEKGIFKSFIKNFDKPG